MHVCWYVEMPMVWQSQYGRGLTDMEAVLAALRPDVANFARKYKKDKAKVQS